MSEIREPLNNRVKKVCVGADSRKEMQETAVWDPLISALNRISCSLRGSKEQGSVSAPKEEEGKLLVWYQLLSLPSQTLGQGQTPQLYESDSSYLNQDMAPQQTRGTNQTQGEGTSTERH